MSNFKLYMGGYKHINAVVVARDKQEAIEKLYEQLNLGSLPCEVEEVELPGYIVMSKQDFINATSQPILDIEVVNEAISAKLIKPKK